MKILVVFALFFSVQVTARTQSENLERFVKYHVVVTATNSYLKNLVNGMYLSEKKSTEIYQYLENHKIASQYKMKIKYNSKLVQIGPHTIEMKNLMDGYLLVNNKMVSLNHSSFENLMANLNPKKKTSLFSVFVGEANASIKDMSGDIADGFGLGLWVYAAQEYYERCRTSLNTTGQEGRELKCFDSLGPAQILSKNLKNKRLDTSASKRETESTEVIESIICKEKKLEEFQSTNFKVNCNSNSNCSYTRTQKDELVPGGTKTCKTSFDAEKVFEADTFKAACSGELEPVLMEFIFENANECCEEYPNNVVYETKDGKSMTGNLCLANILAVQESKSKNKRVYNSLSQESGGAH